jgi:hypothetical protein
MNVLDAMNTNVTVVIIVLDTFEFFNVMKHRRHKSNSSLLWKIYSVVIFVVHMTSLECAYLSMYILYT